MDRLREAKAAPSPFAGIPVSIKDLFDIKGQVTRAGSRALEDSPPAEADATGGGAAAPRRLHRDRPHQHDRVRLFRHRHQSALRHAEERLAAQRRPCARRIVVGRGGVRRRRHGAWRARHRHRRLLPDSGGLSTASSASSRRSGACRSTAACRCRSRSTVLGRWRARWRAARCSMPCWPMSRSRRCSRARSRACGWRCRPRSRSTISRMPWRRPSSARWKRCRAQGALIERIAVPEFLDVGVMNAKGGFAAAESYAWHRYLIDQQGRRLRSPRLQPHPARRSHQRGRLYRSARRAAVADRAHRSAHRAL